MKKITLKRICLEFVQHVLAAGILLSAAGLFLNSYIRVNSIDGTKIYKIFPNTGEMEFEESEIYHDLFQNTVSDITQLVAMKGQMETNGEFDPAKRISVTDYATIIKEDNGCNVTAVYELDDLIKWGKYGVELVNRSMTLSEFVNYFGYCIYPENFTLDEYGQISFDGFYRMGIDSLETGEVPIGLDGEPLEEEPVSYGKDPEAVSIAWEKLQNSGYTMEQFEGMILSYIIDQNLDGLDMSYEDDGLRIHVPMITCRYATVDGEKILMHYAQNWVDYLRLQHNLVATINSLTLNYQRYQICSKEYSEGNSNVKYVIRMMTDEGLCTYTNISELEDKSDESITEVFSEYHKYLIYYPDSLVFMGNTILNERELYDYVSVYDYAYPETTHIWMGMDTSFSTKGDVFYEASALYERIVPTAKRYITLAVCLFVIWFTIVVYLTVISGVIVNEEGEKEWKLLPFDKCLTEVLLIVMTLFVVGGYYGYQILVGVAQKASVSASEYFQVEMQLSRLYQYVIFALYGIYISVGFTFVWYGLVRRYKCETLWKNSLLRLFFDGMRKLFRFTFRHRNTMTGILMPYNLYLFLNLVGIVAGYQFRDNSNISLCLLVAIVVFNGIIGVLLFRKNAEQNEIIDGINKIRDGEVDFKLETEGLHGSNRDLADAVNNIGEGIRKAVKTSMKDEQMKTDLITNVSHDIKTPLTSIISYVDLLKRLKIKEEPAKSYIDILDNKAQRLKQLTDDLVEASKISSGNIILNKEKLNLAELVNQGIGELSDKFEQSGLSTVLTGDEIPAYIFADSRRMWRVLENLLNNVCKYAMTGTRVYIDLVRGEGKVYLMIKNISKQQMNIKPDELTERFIRGDSARSTEGSGLGLSIAKSLTQVQGGDFEIYLDGDLFKVTISFPEFSEDMALHEEKEGNE